MTEFVFNQILRHLPVNKHQGNDQTSAAAAARTARLRDTAGESVETIHQATAVAAQWYDNSHIITIASHY